MAMARSLVPRGAALLLAMLSPSTCVPSERVQRSLSASSCATDGLRHSKVVVPASCADLGEAPAASFLALNRMVGQLLNTSRGVTYSLTVVIDDSSCPDRCAKTLAALGPHERLRCVSMSSTVGTQAYWEWHRQGAEWVHPSILHRPDVLEELVDTGCAPHTWALEMDVALAGQWDELLSQYDGNGALAAGTADLLLPSEPIACGATASEDEEAFVSGEPWRAPQVYQPADLARDAHRPARPCRRSVPVACPPDWRVAGMAYRCGGGAMREIKIGALQSHSFPRISRCAAYVTHVTM